MPWTVQERGPEFTVLSFLHCQKYPPSLCYLLMTLGPALLLLALFDAVPAATSRVLVVFGRVPLFFYLLHLPLIFVTGLLLIAAGWPPQPDRPAAAASVVGLLGSPPGAAP